MKTALAFLIVQFHITIVPAQVTLQYIRSATVKITSNNVKILVDPILADKGTEAPIFYSNDKKNPTSALPFSKQEVIKDIAAILLTHYHSDHFDGEAERFLPKNMLIFCQPGDDKKLQQKGFTNTRVIDSSFTWKEITISRFKASHYKGANGELPFGESSSYFFSTGVFITGDAIFDERMKNALQATQPSLIVANTGECQFTKENPVLAPGTTMTLTAKELKELAAFMPASTIVAVHMDAINHCSLTKTELRKFIESEHLKARIKVPNEGELLP